MTIRMLAGFAVACGALSVAGAAAAEDQAHWYVAASGTVSLLDDTGGTIANETAADLIPTINRIFHDRAHPSYLILPIIERY